MTNMHNPPHPGSILREDVLPALGLSVTEAAGQLGIGRVALSRVINEHAAISAEMACRLGKWLGNGDELWLRMQVAYDLFHARKAAAAKIGKIKRVKVPQAAVGV